jgi:large subunit ribosomal protein L1
VGEAKTGKVEYRTDRQAVIHMAIGKASFTERALLENYAAVIDEIVRAKPASAKGRYLISITLTTSMGPGIKVDTGVQRESEILGVEVEEASGNGAAPAADDAAEEPAEEESPA